MVDEALFLISPVESYHPPKHSSILRTLVVCGALVFCFSLRRVIFLCEVYAERLVLGASQTCFRPYLNPLTGPTRLGDKLFGISVMFYFQFWMGLRYRGTPAIYFIFYKKVLHTSLRRGLFRNSVETAKSISGRNTRCRKKEKRENKKVKEEQRKQNRRG